MILEILKYLIFLITKKKPETKLIFILKKKKKKVIIVLKSNYIRTLQTPNLNEPNYTISIKDEEALTYGKVVIPFKNFEEEKLH
jgi:hypothetical protein